MTHIFKSITNVFNKAKDLVGSQEIVEPQHPWFNGFKSDNFIIPDKLSRHSPNQLLGSVDLSAPILILARGHSGTRALTKLLDLAGVYIGDTSDSNSLNPMYDSLYWTYGFQATLIPKLFKPGVGCTIDDHVVTNVALECLKRHLSSYRGGPWGFKTCGGMFNHSLYRYVFPRAKYIYIVRDGRDVVLSDNGYFYLTNPVSRQQHWEYFKIFTFGISNDIHSCPFKFPKEPHKDDEAMRNRFWIHAKCWREHVIMMEHLRKTGQLSKDVHLIKYEELCSNPVSVVKRLFDFLGIELPGDVRRMTTQLFHTNAIGKWKEYKKHISNYNEDIEMIFDSMQTELQLLDYID